MKLSLDIQIRLTDKQLEIIKNISHSMVDEFDKHDKRLKKLEKKK